MSSLNKFNDPTQKLVFGFTRDVQSLFPYHTNPYYTIPSDVNLITLSYIDNYFKNDGVYIWKIDDINTVNNMLNAKCGDKFISTDFEIARLKWRLEIYPNGNDKELDGFFIIHLRLLSLPCMVDKIVISRLFRVMENMAGSTWIASLSAGDHEYWSKKCPLNELINMKCKTITIYVEISVNKIILKQHIPNNIANITYRVRSNEGIKIGTKQQLEYKIDGDALRIFKNSLNYKSMCSDFTDIWSLAIYPNGMEEEDEGMVGIYLNLCKLPANLLNMSIKFTMCCKETNKKCKVIRDYNLNNLGVGACDFIVLEEVKDLQTLTFMADIEIMEIDEYIDMNGVSDETQIAMILSTST